MTRAEIKEQARDFAKTNKWNVWKAVLIVLFISLIVFMVGEGIKGLFPNQDTPILSSIVENGEENTLIDNNINYMYLLIDIIVYIVLIPLEFGMAVYMLQIIRGKNPEINNLKRSYNSFRKFFGIDLLVFIRIFPIVLVCVILFIIGFNYTVIRNVPVEVWSSDVGYAYEVVIYFIELIGLLIVASIVAFIASLPYAMVRYVANDEQDLTANEVVKRSKELMIGNKFNYLVFKLSFVGWILLSIIVLVVYYQMVNLVVGEMSYPYILLGYVLIGLVNYWILPYITLADAEYYEQLK